MTDILIRGLSNDDIERVDRAAEEQGMSRNEFLRRMIQSEAPRFRRRATPEDWERFHELTADLRDPEVMRQAWS